MLNKLNEDFDELKDIIEKAELIAKHLFGPALVEFNLLMQETLRFRRLRNQVEILEKVKEIVFDSNLTLRQVNLKALVPLLEGIGLEESEELQKMWANLLVNYLDSAATTISVVYPSILKSLSTNEVRFLWHLHEHPESGINTASIHKTIEFELHEINNLERLSLIEGEIKFFQMTYGSTEVNWKKTDNYFLSKFGKDFLRACVR